MEKTLAELAAHVGGEAAGDPSVRLSGVAGLDDADGTKISFLANPKYAAKVATTAAGAVILPPGTERGGKNALYIANPYLAFAKIVTLFHVKPHPAKGIMPGAHVAESAAIGSDVSLYPGCYVGEGATIGDRTILHPGAVVYAGAQVGDDVVLHANVSVREGCRIGNRVILHNGTVVGSDGFGYAFDGRGHYKFPQIGIVVIEDDVEIGANTAIDRAALGATVIRRGAKIDNLVQIAHNVVVGESSIVVSQVGISGSTRLGPYVTLGGQVGVAGHLEIGPKVMVAAKSGVHNSIPAGEVYAGLPAMPHKQWLRASMSVPKLPEMRRTLTALEKKVRELEEQLAQKN